MAISPSAQLQTKSVSIKEILKSAYFIIPPNQREYRWRVEQRKKLWNDLVTCIKDDFLTPENDILGHFLGAVVVIGDEQSLPQKRWEVIDGQQRLTTITILAASLLPYAEKHSHRRTRQALVHVLTDCIFSPGTDEAPRMELNRENEFYIKTLLEHDTLDDRKKFWETAYNKRSEVQENIKEAFEYFDEQILNYIEERAKDDPDKKDEVVRDLVEALTENFYILVVRTKSLMLAYRLFETLNERGLDLSQADLIRNILLQYAKFSGEKSFNNVVLNWQLLTDNYEEQPAKKLSIPQIIQFSYSYRHKSVKGEKIFDDISQDLAEGYHSPAELSRQFAVDSQNWVSFLLGDLVNWDRKVSAHQYAIVDPLWKVHAAPLILAVMDLFSDRKNDLSNAFMLIEHFLFRRGLVGKESVGNLQEVFSEAAETLKITKSFDELAKILLKRSPDKVFVEEFKSATVKNMKQAYYCIWKIENHLQSNFNLELESQSAAQHLEHIMPKRPGSEWNGIEKEDSFNSYLNRIGNFLILPGDVNRHIKNKKLAYKISNDTGKDYSSVREYKLVEEFVDNYSSWCVTGEWGYDAIERRQRFIAEKYALEVWPLTL